MKRLIIAVTTSMVLLVGCASQSSTVTQIREGGRETYQEGLIYDTEQEDAILFSDLEKEFKNNNMVLTEDDHPDALRGVYKFDDGRVNIRVLVDEFIVADRPLVSGVFMEPRNNYMLLGDHPGVKAIASVMGKDHLLTWLADREGEMTQAGIDKKDIEEILTMGRSYLSFNYSARSDTRRLEFKWAFQPEIPRVFEGIGGQLEEDGMLITGYIKGAQGETLVATSSNYGLFAQNSFFANEKMQENVDKAVAYEVMHDTTRPDTYSVQAHGYMRGDPAHPKQVEAMPGLDKISQRMNMGQDAFLAITAEINKELEEAKRVRNNVYKGVYYVEGEVGEYRYAIAVPSGNVLYNFTVLLEKI